MKTYKPLPSSVTIEPSEIHGLGVVAIQDILPNTSLEVGLHGDKWILITNRYIKSGEEITWKYDFYDPTSPAVA